MIKVRGGTFWMGRSGSSHRVKISRPLQVASVPVTQELYQLIMNRNPSSFIGPQRPVEQVSFWEAILFCNKLSERCGYPPAYLFYQENGQPCVEWSRSSNGFRLLTEAEWEYTAKGGREAAYAGSENLSEVGWYQENSKHQTHNVGQKSPNQWGLFDCSGNVWEWCFDEWDEHAYQGRKGSLNVDPLVSEDLSADRRVRRGGAWVSFNLNCSTSYRFWGRAAAKIDDTGFRIARTL
jgi:formylglycine-generating enzyme required for sulfatase activity